MENTENTNEKHYLTGNTYAAREKLKELGCEYDPDKRQWYHTDPEKAKEAQKHVPPIPERYQIGDAPKTLTDELKEMGCKWNKENGWYHLEKEVADKAIQRINEVEPRHYLDGDGYNVKDQLTAMRCRWDGRTKQWYTTDPEKVAEAQALINSNVPEQKQEKQSATDKHYIEGENTRAVKDQLKELGCKWDRDKQQWYHTDPAKAKEAQRLVDGKAPEQKQEKQRAADKHYIEGENTRAVKDQLKELGCKWDPDKQQWYHTDLAKAKEAQRLVDGKTQKQEKQPTADKHYIEGENTRTVKDQLKELGCKWDRDKQQWYHTDPAKAKEAQRLVDNASGPTGVDEGRPGHRTGVAGRNVDGNSVNRVVEKVSRDM